MTFTAYDLMWLTYAAVLVILLWPRASRDVSAVLLLHGKALGLLYRGVRQEVGDYLGQMGLRQRREVDIQESTRRVPPEESLAHMKAKWAAQDK